MSSNVYDVAVATYQRDEPRPAIPTADGFIMRHVTLKASTTYAKGAIIAESNATPGLFSPAGTASHSTARAILPVACATDASGNITIGTPKVVDPAKVKSVEAIFGGYVRTQDVPGLDTTLAAELGRLVLGTVSDGILRIG